MAAKKKTTKKAASKKAPAKKRPAKKAVKKSAKKTTKKVAKVEALKTYVFFVLDKSASMTTIRAETINHFNEQVEAIQKQAQDQDVHVSLTVFNHDVAIDSALFNRSINKIKPLTLRRYEPNGSTAMYDAVGLTIDKAEKEIEDIAEKDVAILFVILSDGQENASHKYSREDVAERIQRLKETGRWTFAYLGANQDLSQVQQDLNLDAGNVQAFVADSQGMSVATSQSVGSTQSYFTTRSKGVTAVTGYYKNSK